MQKLTIEENRIHKRAVEISLTYHRAERDLLKILKYVDRTKLFRKLGQSSLFCYLHKTLEFSPAVARAAVTIYRKAKQVPELKRALERKDVSMSTASRFVSAVTTDNVTEMIEFAKTHTHKQIDREVARINPKSAQAGRIRPISADLFQSTLTFTAEMMKDLERLTDILAQAGTHASPSEVVAHALKLAIYHKDPVQKAARAMARKQKKQDSARMKSRASSKSVTDSVQTECCARIQTIADLAQSVSHPATGAMAEVVQPGGTNADVDSPQTDSATGFNGSGNSAQTELATRFESSKMSARAESKKSARKPLTAERRHEVMHRDKGRCTHVGLDGVRCAESRYIEIHHIRPIYVGGGNELENLTILCGYHHDLAHQLAFPIEGQVTWFR